MAVARGNPRATPGASCSKEQQSSRCLSEHSRAFTSALVVSDRFCYCWITYSSSRLHRSTLALLRCVHAAVDAFLMPMLFLVSAIIAITSPAISFIVLFFEFFTPVVKVSLSDELRVVEEHFEHVTSVSTSMEFSIFLSGAILCRPLRPVCWRRRTLGNRIGGGGGGGRTSARTSRVQLIFSSF